MSNYKGLFVEMYSDESVQYLQFQFQEPGLEHPESAQFQLKITNSGITILTSSKDPDSGEVLWVPDDEVYTDFDTAAHKVLNRYLLQPCFFQDDEEPPYPCPCCTSEEPPPDSGEYEVWESDPATEDDWIKELRGTPVALEP